MAVPVSAVVLTYNEEANLERCLESLKGWADEIVVIDSFSTDATLEIAGRYADRIVQHAYENHPAQWAWALAGVPYRNDWIFAVDADFAVSPELKRLAAEALAAPEIHGYYVRHRQIFRRRTIRFGGIYPRYWLRFFRRGRVRVDEKEKVDVHFYVDGPVGRIEADVVEDNVKDRDLKFWMEKQERFAVRHAREEYDRVKSAIAWPVEPSLTGTPDQKILYFKRLWYRMPLFVRPVVYFIYRYFFLLGFLDGWAGLLYHGSQGFCYRWRLDVHLGRLRRGRA